MKTNLKKAIGSGALVLVTFGASLGLTALPAFAQFTYVPAGQKNLSYLVMLAIGYLNEALVLLMGFAVLMFVWYIIQYFIRPNGGESRKEAGEYLLYSVIGFFVILSFWGLVNILQNTFNLGYGAPGSWASFSGLFPGNGGGYYSGGPFTSGNISLPFSTKSGLPPDPIRQAIFGR